MARPSIEGSTIKLDVIVSETLARFDAFQSLLLGLIRKKCFTPPARDLALFRRVQASAEGYERLAVQRGGH
jgi:hypothetical protein